MIANNETYANGYFSGLVPFWKGGGGKCSKTIRATLRDNYSHNNHGFGMWTDINNIHTLYQVHSIARNRNSGISLEISCDALISRDVSGSDGPTAPVWLYGGAIQIQNSRNATVHDNDIEMMGRGHAVTLIQQHRGSGAYGPHITVRNHVHSSTIIGEFVSCGRSGSGNDFDRDTLARGNNRFEANNYHFPRTDGKEWPWFGETYNWHDYRMIAKQDVNGTLCPKSVGPQPHIDSLKWFEDQKRRSRQQKSDD